VAKPYNLETSLHLHDEAVYTWLGRLRVDYPPDPRSAWSQRSNVPILRVRTTPDRAFADVPDQLVQQGYFRSAAAQGAIWFITAPANGDTVTVGDGTTSVVFTFQAGGAGGTIDNTGTVPAILNLLEVAINSSALQVTALFDNSTRYGAQGSVDLTNTNQGPFGNVTITHTGTVIQNTGMSGGVVAPSAQQMRTEAQNDFTILPLPLVTWQRGDPQPSPTFASAVRESGRYIDPVTGKWQLVPWPGHYLTTYTLTFWCYKQYTDDFMREWIMGQLGNVGAGNFETYIPVNHPAPWATMNQSLKFQGWQDQSVLEGRDVRYKRFQATFLLRTWVMKNMPPEIPNAEKASVDFFVPATASADPYLALVGTGVDTSTQYTGNLFSSAPLLSPAQIPYRWPKSGNAGVDVGKIAPCRSPSVRPLNTLLFAVKDTTDTADIGEWSAWQDGNGLSIFSLSFDYSAIASPVNLVAGQRAPGTPTRTPVYSASLPSQRIWTPIHQFILFNQPIASLFIAGAGTLGKIWLANINVKHIFTSSNPFAPNGKNNTEAVWTQLNNTTQYLCVVEVSSFDMDDVVSVDDDASSPTATRSQSLSVAGAVGVVLLSQPINGSLRVYWPETTVVSNIWVQPYNGGYNGSVL
jgi:hypothetical protein